MAPSNLLTHLPAGRLVSLERIDLIAVAATRPFKIVWLAKLKENWLLSNQMGYAGLVEILLYLDFGEAGATLFVYQKVAPNAWVPVEKRIDLLKFFKRKCLLIFHFNWILVVVLHKKRLIRNLVVFAVFLLRCLLGIFLLLRRLVTCFGKCKHVVWTALKFYIA